MLECARVGAVHSVVFAGFSATALAARINDSQCKMLITADGSFRGNKTIALKEIADKALLDCKTIDTTIVLKRTGQKILMNPNVPEATYKFYFKDKNGCDDDVEFEVKRPEAIEKDLITSESKTALACHGDSDGKLTFVGKGGWTEPWTGNTLNPNGWGASYTFKLLDENGNELKNQTGDRAFGESGQIGYKTSFTGYLQENIHLLSLKILKKIPMIRTLFMFVLRNLLKLLKLQHLLLLLLQ